MDDKLKSIVTQARARIIWGNPLSDVEEWLKSEGLAPQDIEAVIQTCVRERGKEVRRLGLRDLIIGTGLCLGSVALYLIGELTRMYLYAIAGLAFFGLWRLGRGIERLVSGSKAEGSITDM